MMQAAIIDTNAVVAGLLTARKEAPDARILDGMIAGAWPFVLSEALLAEYASVLIRPKLRRLHGLDDSEIDVILVQMTQHAIVLEPEQIAEQAPDPNDQHLWELLYVRPDLILVTGDLELRQAAGLGERIISPDVFVERHLRKIVLASRLQP